MNEVNQNTFCICLMCFTSHLHYTWHFNSTAFILNQMYIIIYNWCFIIIILTITKELINLYHL